MKSIRILAVAVVLAFFAVPVLAEEGPNTLLGAGFEEVGEYERTVEFRAGSELHGQEAIAFRDAFLEIKERLPEKSYFEIVRFPELNRYHVRFSDGYIYVAAGSGPTVEAAFEDLVAKFK